jgi:hypothetical protein
MSTFKIFLLLQLLLATCFAFMDPCGGEDAESYSQPYRNAFEESESSSYCNWPNTEICPEINPDRRCSLKNSDSGSDFPSEDFKLGPFGDFTIEEGSSSF